LREVTTHPTFSALDQLSNEHHRLQRWLEGVVRKRRPDDTRDVHLEMVQHAWVYLVVWACQHQYPVTWERLRRHAAGAARKGIRDHRAFAADLSINAYARYVSLCQVQGMGRGFWPEGTRPSEFAHVFNTSGDNDDVHRRQQQGRIIHDVDVDSLFAWMHRTTMELAPSLTSTYHDDSNVREMMRVCIETLDDLAFTNTNAVGRLAKSYADELRSSIAAGLTIPSLSLIAHNIGLVGGSHTRTLATVRSTLQAALAK
jgi:hypothetical protein